MVLGFNTYSIKSNLCITFMSQLNICTEGSIAYYNLSKANKILKCHCTLLLI